MNAKKFLLLLIVAIPLIYLGMVWNELPDKVPTHWNYKGEIDGYGGKSSLFWIIFFMPILTLLIFEFLPQFDPKFKIKKNNKKYQNLEFSLVSVMSAIATYIIYTAAHPETGNSNIINILIGLMFIIIGNFMITIPQNYFIGLRTPWSLESADNWKKSNRLGGYLMVISGILIMIGSLFLDPKTEAIFSTVLILSTAAISILYSYLIFRQEKQPST